MARKKYSGEPAGGKRSPARAVGNGPAQAEVGATAVCAANGSSTARTGSHSPPAGPSGSAVDNNKQQSGYLGANRTHYLGFREQLARLGLVLKDVPGDGNCLFRALGDQLEGNGRNHFKHRMDVVRFMLSRRQDFEPFIEVPFERYMDNLSRLGTYAGQDALVAFARMHRCNIVIHQLNQPLWLIEGLPMHGPSDMQLTAQQANAQFSAAKKPGAPAPGNDGLAGAGATVVASVDSPLELHLSYHNGEHYSSVRRRDRPLDQPARVFLAELLRDFRDLTPLCAAPATGTTDTVVSAKPRHKQQQQQQQLQQQQQRDPAHDAIRLIASMTQCGDSELIATAYEACGGNVETAVEYIIASVYYEANATGCAPELGAEDEETRIERVISDLTPAAPIGVPIERAGPPPADDPSPQPQSQPQPLDQSHPHQQQQQQHQPRRKMPAQQAHLSNRARKEQRRREKAELAVRRKAKNERPRPPAQEQLDQDAVLNSLRCLNL